MANAPSVRDVARAIDMGLAYLERIQLPSGEFQTFTGPQPDLLDAIPFTKSPYITTYIGHSLAALPGEQATVIIQRRIADFLEAEEEPDGSWNFQGRGDWRIPADLDTTACAAAALVVLGRRQPRSFYGLLLRVMLPCESTPGGPYYTYIGVNDDPDIPIFAAVTRELDVLVNVSVAFFGGHLGIALPGATEFLLSHFRHGVFTGQNRYYVSSHFQAYTLSRAYADGQVRALAPALPALRRHLHSELPTPAAEESAFNVACRAASLINLGERDDVLAPYLEALLSSQDDDGGWPIWAAGAGFPREWDWSWLERWPDGPASADRGWCWGCRAMTTALAIEALGKWRQRSVVPTEPSPPCP